ncbi:hypothetical protein PV327_003792 [Microctonus hyperodae]|uniref:Farnesoic acid O-methyl transferase domain-containing protein n=1 Tax=Microctonus hyperodae TaxID=165561 RepID=A0AA39G4Q6_MICHY|nr:hypothetical protein PV327_003792 [Microctonus hyperodae]
MKAIFIILIVMACLLPIFLSGGYGISRLVNNRCTSDTDCGRSKKCSENTCISPCDGVSCGNYGHCEANNNHTSSCICESELYFNSSIGECVSHVITKYPFMYIIFINNKRYVQFYLKGDQDVNIYFTNDSLQTNENMLFMISVDTKIEGTNGEIIIIDELPPNTLSDNEYRGFWFSWDDSTMKFGKIDNHTLLHSYPIKNGLKIRYIHLSTKTDAEWLVEGLIPEKINIK